MLSTSSMSAPASTDISEDFAGFIANARYEDIPMDAIEAAKKSILDTVGVMMAATGVVAALRHVDELVRDSGGRPESSILGFGGRAPAVMAAFANGAMAHCLDFDDHAPEGHHPSSSIVPAVFALAERVGGISGREMIVAVATGQDMFLRLRRNVGWRQDWMLSTLLGVFSAAGSGGRIIGLNREQLVNAFGIAGMHSGGTMELAYGVGSDLRGMYSAFSTKGAVLSALMAQKGITGTRSVFEGKAGLFATCFDGKYDRAKMLAGLGRDYSGGSILYKPWPSCGVSHTYIHATIQMMKQHALTMRDVEVIRVHVGDFANRMCLPLEGRRKPSTLVDAKFSVPFCVALAATRGNVRIADFTEGGLQDPEVLSAAQKVVPVFDDSYNWTAELPAGRVDIVTRDGRTFTRLGDDVPGSPATPMNWDYIFDKFRDSAGLAAVAPSVDGITKAHEMARHLEILDDATELIRVLA